MTEVDILNPLYAMLNPKDTLLVSDSTKQFKAGDPEWWDVGDVSEWSDFESAD